MYFSFQLYTAKFQNEGETVRVLYTRAVFIQQEWIVSKLPDPASSPAEVDTEKSELLLNLYKMSF